jgi:hypothetical protein
LHAFKAPAVLCHAGERKDVSWGLATTERLGELESCRLWLYCQQEDSGRCGKGISMGHDEEQVMREHAKEINIINELPRRKQRGIKGIKNRRA